MANPRAQPPAPLQHNCSCRQEEELYLVMYMDQVYYGKGKNQKIVLDPKHKQGFGLTVAIDWPLYDGHPDSKPKLVAQARGQHMQSGMAVGGQWLFTSNIVFGPKSRHPGSTIVFIGTRHEGHDEGQWAIVGGTGDFTFAQGVIYYEVVKTYDSKEKKGELKQLDIRLKCKPVQRSELRHVFCEFSPPEIDDGIGHTEHIGEGGFGRVYKADIRGITVAVKILINAQTFKAEKELKHEIDMFKTIQHENLVTLIGACIERRALVYEYCPKNTLASRMRSLSWEERVRAARGICSGLQFLHALQIAHCDLKPNNILFDAQDVCKICDFGLVRLLKKTRETETHVHYTDPKGTLFYIDPEFVQRGKLTRKSDVYALGIILLQLVTGEQPAGLRDWVFRVDGANVDDTEKCQQLADRNLVLNATLKQDVLKMMHLGLSCSNENRSVRPDVANVLSEIESMKIRPGSSSH